MKEVKNSGLIKPDEIVKMKKVGNEVIIKKINICNKKPTVKRIHGGRHVNLTTGEVIINKKTTHRGQSLQSLRVSNNQLKDIIKENTIDNKKMLLLTLTYREKNLDFNMIVNDFKIFMKKVRNTYTNFGPIEYINIIEPYIDKGGYHIHAILFCNQSKKSIFMPISELYLLWGKGNIDIGQPNKNQDVSCYLTPHTCDKITEKNRHMHLKALMRHDMPTGQKLYRCSRGIKRPQTIKIRYEDIREELRNKNYAYKKSFIYASPLKGYDGKPLFYCNEIYKLNPSNLSQKP